VVRAGEQIRSRDLKNRDETRRRHEKHDQPDVVHHDPSGYDIQNGRS
jgi:hypothetical protein